jgi:hypothetical protein
MIDSSPPPERVTSVTMVIGRDHPLHGIVNNDQWDQNILAATVMPGSNPGQSRMTKFRSQVLVMPTGRVVPSES